MARKSKMNMKLIIGVILVIIVIIGGGYMLGLWGGNGGVAGGNLTLEEQAVASMDDVFSRTDEAFRNYERFTTITPSCGTIISDINIDIYETLDNEGINDFESPEAINIINKYNHCTYTWYKLLIDDFINSEFNTLEACSLPTLSPNEIRQGDDPLDYSKLTLDDLTNQNFVNFNLLTDNTNKEPGWRSLLYVMNIFQKINNINEKEDRFIKATPKNQKIILLFLYSFFNQMFLNIGFYLVKDDNAKNYKDRYYFQNYRTEYKNEDDIFLKRARNLDASFRVGERNNLPNLITSPPPLLPAPAAPFSPTIEGKKTFDYKNIGETSGILKFKKIYMFHFIEDFLDEWTTEPVLSSESCDFVCLFKKIIGCRTGSCGGCGFFDI
jgi:hypothetical protein